MDIEDFKYSILSLKGLLTKHVRLLLKDDRDVEDIIQETFLKLWKMRDELKSHPNVTGLSVMIAKNLSLNQLKEKKRMEPLDILSLSTSKDLNSEIELKDEVKEILKIIDNFPSLQKQIFLMKHVDEYEVNEIAEITGSSKESIRMHLSRARRRINENFLR
ncbi:RNA polymerase sigma factor [Dysgonomonas sp. Marseille-P4677]|uniref:RNA polymerase sigma factor n=1 Tax=Dysgonomonas sp. Marseille-P4677 TaxID=2364790 RepID=UPI001913C259|nr:RNA polymerase sigma factor [Dysgonomonas sp. Marseille-P4677]MBK5722224.1 RNA polymerase sigma factor [Dysgonomonas sp. Marseille-P4677]